MNATTRPAGVLLLIATATFDLAGCVSSRSASDYDPTAKFNAYTTFALMPREHGRNEDQPAIRKIEKAIEARLEHKGFDRAESPDRADMIVDFTLGSGGRLDSHSYPTPYAGNWFWDAPLRGGPYWGQGIDSQTYRDGILSIDIFDAGTHRPIWHGWSRVPISQPDSGAHEDSVTTVVRNVLSEYPPGHMQ